MRKRIAITLLALLPGVVFLVAPGVGTADPKPIVGPHLHFIVHEDGSRTAVGPVLCGITDPTQAQKQAFSNFHWNVHRGADGLDNDLGAEIVSAGCPA